MNMTKYNLELRQEINNRLNLLQLEILSLKDSQLFHKAYDEAPSDQIKYCIKVSHVMFQSMHLAHYGLSVSRIKQSFDRFYARTDEELSQKHTAIRESFKHVFRFLYLLKIPQESMNDILSLLSGCERAFDELVSHFYFEELYQEDDLDEREEDIEEYDTDSE